MQERRHAILRIYPLRARPRKFRRLAAGRLFPMVTTVPGRKDVRRRARLGSRVPTAGEALAGRLERGESRRKTEGEQLACARGLAAANTCPRARPANCRVTMGRHPARVVRSPPMASPRFFASSDQDGAPQSGHAFVSPRHRSASCAHLRRRVGPRRGLAGVSRAGRAGDISRDRSAAELVPD